MAPETNATGRHSPMQHEWGFMLEGRTNSTHTRHSATTAVVAADASAAAAAAGAAASAAARAATSAALACHERTDGQDAASRAALAAATEAALDLEIANDYAAMFAEVEDDVTGTGRGTGAGGAVSNAQETFFRSDNLMEELQRARERALSLQQRFQTARAFSGLDSDRAVSLEDAEADSDEDADHDDDNEDDGGATGDGRANANTHHASTHHHTAAAVFSSSSPHTLAARMHSTNALLSAAGALSATEQLEQRRLEEQHQLNLAMQFAAGLDDVERQEYYSLFFSRLREGAEGAFAEAAQSYTLILSGLNAGGTGDVPDHDDADDAYDLDETEPDTDTGRAHRAVAPRSDKTASATTGGGSRFEQLRDVIYGEVATFIAANEEQPHFLYRVFQQLNGMTSDYLRQRTLYLLQELTLSTLDADRTGDSGAAAAAAAAAARRNGYSAVEEHDQDHDHDYDLSDGDFTDLAELSASQRGAFVRRLLAKAPTAASPDHRVAYQGDYDETLSVGSVESRDTAEVLLAQMEDDLQALRAEEAAADAGLANIDMGGAPQAVHRRAVPRLSFTQRQIRDTAENARRLVEEASVASTGGGAPTTDREEVDDATASHGAGSGSLDEQDSLLVSAFQPEIEVNRQVLAAVQSALGGAGPHAHMSPERVSSLCALVSATLEAEAGSDGSPSDDSASSLMAVVVRGVLEKYAGENLRDCGPRVLADLENVLYDEMIFERVITQVSAARCCAG